MKAELIANDLVKLPVSVGTPVFAIKELGTRKTVTLIEYSLQDINLEVYSTREEAEQHGFKVVRHV